MYIYIYVYIYVYIYIYILTRAATMLPAELPEMTRGSSSCSCSASVTKSSVLIAMICTASRRLPAGASTIQGPEKGELSCQR